MGHHKLRRLRVYGGFLDQLDINFGDGLCCVIGGRGSGKTTVLEFIRHALDRAPRAAGPGSKLADERFKALLAANLGASGCVELEFESKEGLVYNIRRTAHEPPVITDAAGKQLKAEMLGSSVLIDAAIFSHNQIEDIAHNPAAQRELIDRLQGQSLQTLEARMAQTTSLLRENAQRIVQLQVRIQGATRNLVDLSSWESKLAAAITALGGETSPAFKAAAMSDGSVCTPFTTPGPPSCQRIENSRSASRRPGRTTATSTTTSVPPSTRAADDSSLTVGPSSRTVSTSSRSDPGGTANAVTLGSTRATTAEAKQPPSAKKRVTPCAAAASRSGTSFWSGRQRVRQSTAAFRAACGWQTGA